MNSRKPPRRAWVVLIVLGAFALRVWQLDVQSLWFDELVAVYAASQPLPEIPAADPSNPPLYFILLHGWLALAGASPFAIRLLPALLGTLLVAGVWALGRRQGGPATGLLAAALAAISPLLWWYAQEGRMYTLMALEVLALIFLVDRLARRPGDRRAWLAAFVIEAAALFTHNLGAAVAAWFNLAVMGAWLYRRRWRVLARWLAVQAVLGAALLPWLVWRGQLVYSLANPTYAPPDLSALLGAWAALWAGSWTLVGAEPGFVQLTWLLLALVGVGAAAARRAGAPKLLAHVALIVAPGMIFLAVGRFAYHPRYFVVAAAPALALAAMGAVGLARARRAVGPLLAAALVTLALGLSGYALHRINTTPAYGRDDARGLADYYRRVLAPGDVVVVPYAYAREYTLWYYGVPDGVEVVELDSAGFDAAYAALSARLGASDAVRVEVMDWDKAFGDRRGVLDCLLMGSGRRLGEPFRVVGLGTQGYEIRAPLMLPPALPPAQPVEADFGAFRLTGAAFMAGGPADRARCVVLDWQLAAPVDYGAAAALTVTNALGWEIARADAPLLRDDFAPASLWEAGQTVQGFAVVQLPPDTPPGDYALRVRVYRTDTLQALDWRIDGAPVGKDASLGTLAVGPPAQPPALVEDGDGFLQISADLPAGWALAYRAPGSGPVRAGETLRVTLRWRVGEAPAPVGRLCAGACVDLSPPGGAPGAVLLDWYEVTLPPGVSTGTVMLLIDWGGAGNVLAEYDVQAVDHLLTPPPFAVPVGVTFAGAGELVGFSTGAERLTAREALPLMLVWRAAGASDLPYAVFVHLLDAGGRVIAQSDRPPAGGERPTTGWVAGEYIVDEHALVFNEAGADYTGPATLEVGLYDPLTGARAPLEGGGDFVILPVTVEVIK